MVVIFDISHPIQSLFTSVEGISRHGPRLALHLTARMVFLLALWLAPIKRKTCCELERMVKLVNIVIFLRWSVGIIYGGGPMPSPN